MAIVERRADDVALGDLSTPWEFRTRGGLAVQGQWSPYLDRELALVRAGEGRKDADALVVSSECFGSTMTRSDASPEKSLWTPGSLT